VEDPDKPGSNYTVVLREEPYRVQILDENGDVTYLINGMPEDTRTIVLKASETHQRTIVVNKTTGEISVQ